ncbi:Site-specific recombinase XerD [Halopseudomonas litoralis]|uniref:Site-specific recombinase XerD n=1 Tax=Halopseudomonas litoralis TaxID=797277 RepID=A0A1H1PY97_9GAMM|nr:integrase arm-type DNA-binding domain-containing protein [Halopseudomonas litoralis]SDS16195.1 Site-specific recombinase XerD [Halopseudomonas litoralis]
MALSDLTIRQARTTGKDYTLPDFDGLSLAVSAVGGKSWHFRYYWASKQKRMSLGRYPDVSLREARSLRDDARALVAKGINPKTDQKLKLQNTILAEKNSFKAVYLMWFAHRKLELKEGRQSTLSQIRRIFVKDILPRLGTISIFDIRRSHLLDVLARIERRRAFSVAEKVRTWFRQLFRFAMVKFEGIESNPASDLVAVAIPKPPVANNPFLRLPEMPELLRRLRHFSGRTTTQLGIRLLLLTGVRTGELRQATPDQFDLDQGLWIIPPEAVKQLQNDMRKKKRRPKDIPPYIVPLSVQAIEIVRYLLEQVKPAQKNLLAHCSDLKKCISENTLNAALIRMGYKNLLTGHGIRGTLSTALNEIGYLKTWVDAQLSHADPNKVSATYNHALYVEPRRKMMQDWADRLDLLERGKVQAASRHLTIRIEGMPLRDDSVEQGERYSDQTPLSSEVDAVGGHLPAVPVQNRTAVAREAKVSGIQNERLEMLQAYEEPHNLQIVQFAKLAGKSRDQINREIKAGKLLTLKVGNRGQRIPDWQLDPVKLRLTQAAMVKGRGDAHSWHLYRVLLQPYEQLRGKSPVEAVFANNIHKVTSVVQDALR